MKGLVVANVSDRSEWYLYKELLRRGAHIDLICDPNEQKIDEFRELGGKAYVLHVKHRFDLRAVRFIRDLLKLYDYDFVYSPFNKGLAASALASIGLDTSLITYRGTLGNLSYLNPADYLTYFNPAMKGVACNCKAVKNSLQSYRLAPQNLRAIYKGHDLSWYTQHTPPLRSQYDIPEDAFIISCVANMRPLKGIPVLLEALALLPKDIKPHLLLIGEARDSTVLKQIENHPRKESIHVLGFQKEATRIAGMSDVAVMPSLRREGLPRSIIETMAQEIPAIVTDIGGMPELVNHGKGGVIIPPGDAKSLASALQELALNKDKRLELAKRGKEHLLNDFNLDKYTSKMYELFKES